MSVVCLFVQYYIQQHVHSNLRAAVFYTLAALRWRCAVCLFTSFIFLTSWKSLKFLAADLQRRRGWLALHSCCLMRSRRWTVERPCCLAFSKWFYTKWVLTAAALNPVEFLFVQLFFLARFAHRHKKQRFTHCTFFFLSKFMFLGQKKMTWA